MNRILKSLLIFVAFVGISYLFFHLALDNNFWHGDDFILLSHGLRMSEDWHAVLDTQTPYKFHPLAYGISYLLFSNLLFEPRGYFLFNILLHGLNSYLVYLLVRTLLRDRTIALLSGLLFVFTVGNFGKSIMIASGLEDLLVTTLTLCTMIFYFKSELSARGKGSTAWYLLSLVFFVLCMLTKSTSFSILGAFLAFNYFFRKDTGRRVVTTHFLVLLVLAAAAVIVKKTAFDYTPTFYTEHPGVLTAVLSPAENVINYLVRMIFPVHTSHLVAQSGPAVRLIYGLATEIRIVIALFIVSYSFFGFIFGNHAIRFFIAWTYIMVIPFAFFQFPADWLNIRHLYLVSIGFVMVISSGAVFCSRLIARHRWKRLVPFVVPLFFVLVARFVVVQLDRSYEYKAASAETAYRRELLMLEFPRVNLERGLLHLGPPRTPGAAAVEAPAAGDETPASGTGNEP